MRAGDRRAALSDLQQSQLRLGSLLGIDVAFGDGDGSSVCYLIADDAPPGHSGWTVHRRRNDRPAERSA